MVEVVLFHHACGLTPGVHAFADRLRARGHTVHTPDLFAGRTFDLPQPGQVLAHSLVFTPDELTQRARAATDPLGHDLVYAGMSLGVVFAAEELLRRGGARGALFLYGAIDPHWWSSPWPLGMPAQSHQAEGDPWREEEVDDAYRAAGLGGFFCYPGTGHLFLEEGHPDHHPAAADRATGRVLAYLAELDA